MSVDGERREEERKREIVRVEEIREWKDDQ